MAARRAACVRALCASGPREGPPLLVVAFASGWLSTRSTAWLCQNVKPKATASVAALTINRMRSSSMWSRTGTRASWLMALAIMSWPIGPALAGGTGSRGGRRLLALSGRLFGHGRSRFSQWRLRFVADRVLELPEPLPERAARVGQPFGSEEDEHDAQQDDQVGGLEDAGEHDSRSLVEVTDPLGVAPSGVGRACQVHERREEPC